MRNCLVSTDNDPMKRLRFLLPLLSLALCPPAQSGSVQIQSCYDGDTCRTTTGERIKLACIDTPERGEYGASGATTAIRNMVVGRTVGIRRLTTDRYGRTVAELYAGNTNVGQQLVKEGFARVYHR